MVERKVKVAIPCGIHIRPAGIISHTANGFKADSRIIFGYHVINTASILNLVASGIHCGHALKAEMKSCSSVKDRMNRLHWMALHRFWKIQRFNNKRYYRIKEK